MAVIYLPSNDMSVWKSLGTALGTFAGKRLGDIQKANEAKEYANAWFRPQNQDNKTLEDYANMTEQANSQNDQPLLPKLQGGLLTGNNNQARNYIGNQSTVNTPGIFESIQNGNIGQNRTSSDSTGRAIPSAMANAAQAMVPNVSMDTSSSADNNGLPAMPNREAIRNNLRETNGNAYGDLYVSAIKAGYDRDEARAMTLAKMKEDEDKAYNERAAEYNNKVLNPMREQILNNLIFKTDDKGNTVVDTYNSSKVLGMVPMINRYNELASQAGQPTLDINNINNLAKLNHPDYAYMQGQNGHVIRIDKGAGTASDIGDYSKRYLQTSSGYYDKQTGQFITDPTVIQRIQIAQENADTARARAAGGGGGSTGGTAGTGGGLTSSQLSLAKYMHNNWLQSHPGQAETESPYYQMLVSALPGNNSSSGSWTNAVDFWTKGMDPGNTVPDRIRFWKKMGRSKEEIIDGLKKSGNEQYISYVW